MAIIVPFMMKAPIISVCSIILTTPVNSLYLTINFISYLVSDDLIFKDIKNVSLIGNDQCVITCTSPASMLVINVTNFIFQNIKHIKTSLYIKEIIELLQVLEITVR